MTKIINRPFYLDQLKELKDKKIIKVLTGVRRSGKSTIFKLYQEYLLNNGIKQNQIISLNLEEIENEYLTDYKNLYFYIKERILTNEKNYIFLDEIQEVTDFQKTITDLFNIDNVDIYLTGSNAHLLSGDYATYLSGRYIDIHVFPLSFKEYVSFYGNDNLENKFNDYINNTSFPFALELDNNINIIKKYIDGLLNTIILKDVVTRYKVTDLSLLERISNYLMENISNLSSANKISNFLTSKNRKTNVKTIDNYINYLLNSYLFYKVNRYDLVGKEFLSTLQKYYLVSPSLRHYNLGSSHYDKGKYIENIVYLELKRRNNEVYIGKINDLEIDFISKKIDKIEYYQVSYSTIDSNTLERELKPLNLIKDNHPKYLLTMDKENEIDYNGIKKIYLLDWLLK